MVRELKVIFALDAVARQLRVAGHALVLFQELRRIAALTVILTVSAALTAAEVRPSLPPAATPAAALSLIDQIPTSSNQKLAPSLQAARPA
jgi:hypothetical protein